MIIDRNSVLEGPNGRPIVFDFYTPGEVQNIPVLVFCHGYKGFKDWGAWNLMSEKLVSAGIAVLKFNFSFNGSTISQPIDFPDLEAFGQNNYSKEVRDLEAVIDFIKTDSRFDNPINREHIILMGHSRGGGIVSIVASGNPMIRGLVTLAAVSNFEKRFKIGSEEFNNWKETGVKYIVNGRTKQQMPHYFQFYEDFEQHAQQLNIERAVRSLDIPHLIIHGNADTSVWVNEAHDMAAWNTEARLLIVDDANHVFGVSHPWEKSELSDEMDLVVEAVVDFIIKIPKE